MHKNLRMFLFLVFFVALSGLAQANDHGRGHGKHDRDDDDDRGTVYYSDHDRDGITSTIATIACRLVWPNGIGSLQGWNGSCVYAAPYRPVCEKR